MTIPHPSFLTNNGRVDLLVHRFLELGSGLVLGLELGLGLRLQLGLVIMLGIG